MIYMAKYDFRVPVWVSFGNIVFVEADSDEQALPISMVAASAKHPGGAIDNLVVRRSGEAERDRYNARVRAYEAWLDHVRRGVPNGRGTI